MVGVEVEEVWVKRSNGKEKKVGYLYHWDISQKRDVNNELQKIMDVGLVKRGIQ